MYKFCLPLFIFFFFFFFFFFYVHRFEAVSSMGAAAKWPVCVANGWLHQLSSLILNQIISRNGRLDYSCVCGVKDGWG